jgi:ketosteroid isomerase-like protein
VRPLGGSHAADTAAIQAALTRFLTAFENLDWDAFRASFADDATVFFPLPEPPARFDGHAAVEARFRAVFDAIRAGHPNGPPFHRLIPEDLRIDPLGHDAAIVTFHLRNAERVARRTIVFRRTAQGWKIAHLHASNVAVS